MNMDIKIVNLTEENLKDAPEWPSHPFSCKYCIYWEYPDECVDAAKESKDIMLRMNLKWLRKVTAEFGNCGRIVYADANSIGYAQYAPAKYLPASTGYDSGPPNEGAVLIACLFVPQKHLRGSGIGSLLLHSIIDELRAKGIRAIETFGRKGDPGNPSGPAEFYVRHRFRIYSNDKEFPLLRLDL